MIVAVTGGTGFIGRRLVARLLERGDTVRLLTRQSVSQCEKSALLEVYLCDLVSAEAGELSIVLDGVDVLYHCAAENNDNNKMFVTNVGGTRNLAGAAAGKIKHWVQLSSVGVYGTQTDGEVTEETPMVPVNVYEKSKVEADEIVIRAARVNNFSYSILRPSKVYGAGMSNNVLFQLISFVDRGLFFFVGPPGASANYIHVDDVVDVVIKCGNMAAAKNRIYIISDYRTIEDFVAIIARSLHKSVPRLRISEKWARIIAKMTSFVPRNPLTEQRVSAMVKRAVYSTAKLEAELGYGKRVSMEDGLSELVEEYKKQSPISA